MIKKIAKLPSPKGKALEALVNGVAQRHSISNLEQLGVSQRLINLLESQDINNLEDLLLKRKEDLLSIPNFGEKQLFVLFNALSKYDEAK